MSQVFDVMSDFWKGTYHWESWQTYKGHVDNDFVQRRRRWWCRWFRGKRRRRWCIFAFSQIGLSRERANGNLCHIKGLKKALHQNVVSLSPGRDYMWKSGTSDPTAASVKGALGVCVWEIWALPPYLHREGPHCNSCHHLSSTDICTGIAQIFPGVFFSDIFTLI